MSDELASKDMLDSTTGNDPFLLVQDLIEILDNRALKTLRDEGGAPYQDLRDAPRAQIMNYFAQFEIVSRIFIFKGIESFKAGDPGLSLRMFKDACDCMPPKYPYGDAYLYKAMMMKILDYWDEADEVLKQALAIEPSIMSRFDPLAARFDIDQKTIAEFRQTFKI